jgi:uncharacterized protein (UPF0332 family)
MKYNKEDLIKYRIERANETARGAKSAIDNGFLFDAENRIYYAIFYIVSALAVKHDFSTSKHAQLLGWFNKNFVFTNKQLHDIYKNSFRYRQKGDYDDFVTFKKEDVEKQYQDMMLFVSEIEKLINL